MSDDLLNSLATGRKSGDDSKKLLNTLLQTKGLTMAQSYSLQAEQSVRPKGTGMGDQFEPF